MPLINDYLLNPGERLHWVYLLSAALVGLVYYARWPQTSLAGNNHQGLMRGYWLHRSAVLDYCYFVVVWLIKLYLLVPLLLSAHTVAIGLLRLLSHIHAPLLLHWPTGVIMLFYTATLFVFGEFSRYWLHRWLHTNTWLWQFHKVHHSAEVLTPVTFYRVHPFENFLFGLRYAFSAGLATGIGLWLFGAKLNLYMIGGANATVVIFAFVGGNLRHSHIYLRYPAMVEQWLMSPAQHQLHHTNRYARQNYGSYLSVFDRCFGTLQTTEHISAPSSFGFPERLGSRYRSIGALLWQPFRDCYMLWRRKNEPVVHLD